MIVVLLLWVVRGVPSHRRLEEGHGPCFGHFAGALQRRSFRVNDGISENAERNAEAGHPREGVKAGKEARFGRGRRNVSVTRRAERDDREATAMV